MNYSNFIVAKKSGRIYKLESHWDDGKEFNFARDKNNMIFSIYCPLYTCIPFEFKAYIKKDSVFHGLEGLTINLKLDVEDVEVDFTSSRSEDGCLWFKHKDCVVPNGDIDFNTIQPITPIEDIIPPLPTLEELRYCTIEYSGRKTIITYHDSFVGESKCHPDDTFFITTGIAYAFDRAKKAKEIYDEKQRELKKIKVCNIVKVVKVGRSYSTWDDFVLEICQEIGDLTLCTKYAYGDYLMYSPDRFDEFIVLYINDNYAYIQNCKNHKCRLVDSDAIEKVRNIKGLFLHGGDSYECH